MKVFPVRNPLSGEQVVAVQPELVPRVEAGWRRRLRLFAGRSLSHTALNAEQRSRASRMALLAQGVTPGVVTGLEIGLEPAEVIHLAPGLGVTAAGEDVRLLQPLRVSVLDLRVFTAGSLGSTIGDLLDAQGELPAGMPPVFILVLQPIAGERIGELDPGDSCERDPRNEAFEDQQLVDGCRLVAYLWPTPWLPSPGSTRRRNFLAYALFEREAEERAAGRILPWEDLGVPVGLFDRRDACLDRFSVARPGGRPIPRSFLPEWSGYPGLWQARIQQFAEHMTQLQQAGETDLAGQFDFLPPVGLLPRDTLSLTRPPKDVPEEGGVQDFFSDRFQVKALPVPLDELEVAFQAAAPLAPLNRTASPIGEAVQVLVPVPGALYDPDLLVEEVVSPELEKDIATIRERRADWRYRRDDLRSKVEALNHALAGEKAEPPFKDDSANTDDELPDPLPAEPDEDAYGTVAGNVSALDDLQALFTVDKPFSSLYFEVDKGQLREKGLVKLIADIEARLDKADDRVDLGFLEVQTSIYKLRQHVMGRHTASRLVTSPTLTAIAQGQSSFSIRRDLQEYLQSLQEKRGTQVGVSPPGDESAAAHAMPPMTEVFAAGELADFSPKSLKSATTGSRVLTKAEVIEQTPIIGRPARTVAIAERMQTPLAKEVKDAAIASKHMVVKSFQKDPEILSMVQDLKLPGTQPYKGGKPEEDKDGNPIFYTFGTLKLEDILNNTFDPEPTSLDEAGYFSAAVKALDDAAAILRVVEGRLQLYRAALLRCHETLDQVEGFFDSALSRLEYLEKKLAEARHDLTVAQALLDEEHQRVTGINARREAILEHHVRFLVYCRPRVADAFVDTPVRALDPAPLSDPFPACGEREVEPPSELQAMADLLRDAPLRWFLRLTPVLAHLDRLDVLQRTLAGAKARASAVLPAAVEAQAKGSAAAGPPTAKATQQTLKAQKEIVVLRREETARLDLSGLAQQSWKGSLEMARRFLSLGDLLDLPHGRPQVTQITARELEQITRAATCLYDVFGDVLPTLRLDWVERLSQFDVALDLRRLSILPRWGEVEPLARRQLQGLVDWLAQRIDPDEPEAVALINDLVRVSLLLASHAPVDQLVAAAVAENTTIRKGETFRLKVDPARVRIGMHVLLRSGPELAARGVVEDVGFGFAVARLVDAPQEGIKLNAGTQVQLASPKAFPYPWWKKS
jgi:hypothetical protein